MVRQGAWAVTYIDDSIPARARRLVATDDPGCGAVVVDHVADLEVGRVEVVRPGLVVAVFGNPTCRVRRGGFSVKRELAGEVGLLQRPLRAPKDEGPVWVPSRVAWREQETRREGEGGQVRRIHSRRRCGRYMNGSGRVLS